MKLKYRKPQVKVKKVKLNTFVQMDIPGFGQPKYLAQFSGFGSGSTDYVFPSGGTI